MRYAAKTHVGLVRQLNEDSYALVTDLAQFGVAILADGMGGHLAGEVASSLAIQAVVTHMKESSDDEANPRERLTGAIRRANDTVFQRANSSEELNGMGTTLISALFDEKQIYLGHIGDSRAYLYEAQAGELRQLTEDHTLVNELFKNGLITDAEKAHHPQRNIVTRGVGTDSHVEADLLQLEWADGDILLICSDGLTDMVVQPAKLQEVLQSAETLETKADALVQQALDAGGHDNITVVMVQNESERGEAR